ncbi:MAG: DUF3536 domain-containing protein [Deferrisomatales bacterium]|nr:DUF3536 domain-containing protein [Deferrisomatales bacterium]
MDRCVCIHAHFYQPPRENPWLEVVELQDSAYPYHDWNARITAECYEPNAASRILDGEGRIADIVNNYSRISFNVGPTLLSWLELHAPEVYAAILEADRQSRERYAGHGSALAQAYSHLIMPLANTRDKRTQIRWGIADFERRFGRRPEGMWLAETAADLETLDLLAEEGLRFTILAPRQARRVRRLEGGEWEEVGEGIDPRVPYLCRLPSGREFALFFYDGPIAQDLAFGGLLNDGGAFARRLEEAFVEDDPSPQLVHVATDGESYGHHHRGGDMALAYCIHHLEEKDSIRLTVYGEFLERHPPEREVEIHEGSSWSCIHGVERWRADCGCNSGGRPGWSQAWRGPLRAAMDWLRDSLAGPYEEALGALVRDPWDARDRYVEVLLDRSEDNVGSFLERHATRELSAEEKVRALRLLELQRHALLMYTSCGWFFDELSGLETVQVLQYAARALQLAREACGVDLEPEYVERLKAAPSNLPELGNGAQVFTRYVRPAALDLFRVGAHYAISSAFEDYPETTQIFSYNVRNERQSRTDAGRQRLVVGRALARSSITWNEAEVSYAVLDLGDHNVLGGVREFLGEEAFAVMSAEVREPFLRSDVPEVIRVIDRHFGDHTYSLWHLFRDEQRKVLDQIRYTTLEEVEGTLRQIYQKNYPIMNFLQTLGIPLPMALRMSAEFAVNAELVGLFRAEELDPERLADLLEEVGRWSLEIDRRLLGFVAGQWLTERTERWARDPAQLGELEAADRVLTRLAPAGVELNLRRAQNVFFAVTRRLAGPMAAASGEGREFATDWLDHVRRLSDHLGVRVEP